MTMTTLMVNCTTSWCPSLQTTTSCPSSTLQVLNDSRFDACSKKHPSSTNLMILQEIPTRNYLQDLPDTVVDLLNNPLDDDNDACNTTMTRKLNPTNLDGLAAPLPYQSELAAISAAIAKMQQRDDKTSLHKHHMMTQPFNTKTKLAAISAAINQLENKWLMVPPPLADLQLPLPTPSMPDLLLDDNGSNNHHNVQQSSSSINDVFNVQTMMLHTINMLIVELHTNIDLLLHAAKCPATSIQSLPPATLIPLTTMTTICHKITTQLPTINPQTTQIPPWPLSHINPCNKCIPTQEFSPYCKHIPAKPPFPGSNCTKL